MAYDVLSEHRHATDPSEDSCLRMLPGISSDEVRGRAEQRRYERAVNTNSVSAAFLVHAYVDQDGRLAYERAEAAQPLIASLNEAISSHPHQLRFRWLKAHLVQKETVESIAEQCRTTAENVRRGLNSAAREVCSHGMVRRWREDRTAIRESPARCDCRRAQRDQFCGHTTDRVHTEGGRTPAHWRWRRGAGQAAARAS